MALEKTGTLRRVTIESQDAPGRWHVSIVAVPDIGGRLPSAWQDGTQPWLLSILPTVISNPHILEFSYPNDGTRSFKWGDLLLYGDSLLSQLLEENKTEEFLHTPLVFIAHGLGGYVVKKAVTRLLEKRNRPPFEQLANVLSGIVFLCCPHTPADSETEASALGTLLRACTGMSTRQVAQCQSELSGIFHLSRHFQAQIGETLLISTYETNATKFSSTILSTKREILVGKLLAQVGARNEVMILVEQQHFRACDIQRDSVLFKEVKDFFGSIHSRREDKHTTIGTESYLSWKGSEADDIEDIESATKVVPDMTKLVSQIDHLTLPHTSNQATAGSSGVYGFELVSPPASTGTPLHDRGHVNLPCFLVRPHGRNLDFYGRSEVLQALDDALLPNADAPYSLRTFALCGMGGVGKTQIAVEFVFSRRNHFDAIFMLQASSYAKLAQGFSQVAHELGLENDEASSDQVVSRDLVLGWLSSPTRNLDGGGYEERDNVNWLLIFDNADDLDLLYEFWPVAERGSILITSRDPLAQTSAYIPSSHGMTLKPFSTDEAAALLRSLTKYNSTEQDTSLSLAVANLLGGLPLAITQVAATIIRRDLSFDELLALYEQESSRKSVLNFEMNNKQKSVYAKTIFTTWALEDLKEQAACLLNVLSFLDPDQIHEGILTWFQGSDNPFLALPDFPRNLSEYLEARVALTRSSLIRRNVEFKELAIHRLVQDSAQLRMKPESRDATWQAVISMLYQAWPFGINDYDTLRWKKCELVFAHVQHVMTQHESSRQPELLGPVAEKFGHLLTDAGWYYLERGNPFGSIPFQDIAQRVLESMPEPSPLRLSEVHQAQAESLIMVGKFEAGLEHAKKALGFVLKAQEMGDDPGHRLPQAYNEVAEAYCNLRRYAEGIPLCDKAIALYLEQEGKERHYESSTFARLNKAFCLRRLRRNDEASEVLEELLEVRLSMQGPEGVPSFKTALTYEYLGDVRLSQGLLIEAKDQHWKAYHELLGSVGQNHFLVGGLLYRLALHEERGRRFDQARDLLLRANQIHEDKPYFEAELTRTWIKLVEIYQQLNDEQSATKAEEKVQKLLSSLKKTVGRPVAPTELEDFFHEWAL